MSVTNYYSVNGLILGEKSTGGSRVDYLSDALGSVTATVNNTAQVVNTYRYKPYGTQLTRTGTGSDPLFRWAGMFGYAYQGKASAQTYVRARHYGTDAGRWTTTDPIGYGDGLNLYAYVRNRITIYVDPSGMQRVGPPVGSVTNPPVMDPRVGIGEVSKPGPWWVLPPRVLWSPWFRIVFTVGGGGLLTAGVVLCTAKAAGPSQKVIDEYLDKQKKKKPKPKPKKTCADRYYDYCDDIIEPFDRYWWDVHIVADCGGHIAATFNTGVNDYYRSRRHQYAGQIEIGRQTIGITGTDAYSCEGTYKGKRPGKHHTHQLNHTTSGPIWINQQARRGLAASVVCCPCCITDDDVPPVYKIGVNEPHVITIS